MVIMFIFDFDSWETNNSNGNERRYMSGVEYPTMQSRTKGSSGCCKQANISRGNTSVGLSCVPCARWHVRFLHTRQVNATGSGVSS